MLHSILPRTLEQLSESNAPVSEMEDELIKLFEEEDQADDPGTSKSDKPWEELLTSVLSSKELSPAELNQKRKQLTFQAFRDVSFVPRTIVLENLMEPFITSMDALLRRSGHISDLHHAPHDSNRRTLEERPPFASVCLCFSVFSCVPFPSVFVIAVCFWNDVLIT